MSYPFPLLGCWYTNNVANPKILAASLESIRKAQEYARMAAVDIGTSVWRPLEGNPFPEYKTYHPIGDHFGILVQILQCLKERRNSRLHYGLQPFRGVCFLEHDVLYPKDYFDRVAVALEENPDKEGVSHQDYIGMNETGWQEVNSRHEPMHQISLRWGYALKHLDWVMESCVLKGWELLEPDRKDLLVKIPYIGEAPSVHINHSLHFTSHYNCYARQGYGKDHPYWGNSDDYYPSGEKQAL